MKYNIARTIGEFDSRANGTTVQQRVCHTQE